MGAERTWFDRGTARNPGPHLDRMPVALDLSGISLAEGLRAAIASGLVLLLGIWLHSFPLLLMSFAALLTCFCDTGGLLRSRVIALLFFTGAGAICWSAFGLLRGLGWPVVVPLAGGAVFLCSMARVWGAEAQAVGNVLIVVLALSLDDTLGLQQAGILFVSFLAGGLWAVLLTLVIWRINTEKPAVQAVAQVWRNLSVFVGDLRGLLRAGTADAAAWDAHARAHRRATRAAIEEARVLVVGSVRTRGPTSMTVRRMFIRFEAAEAVFAALIALTDVLESTERRETRSVAADLLRLLRPVLALLHGVNPLRPERFDAVLDRVTAGAVGEPILVPLIGALVDGVRVALRTDTRDDWVPATPGSPPTRRTLIATILGPLRDNLTWRSAILRHAVRATVLTVPAIAWSLIWWTPYSHWLTITVALTMQPYYAATWQRVIERVGGTVLGGLIGASLAFLPQTHFVKAILLLPLCIVGFSVRQVSYGAYIACLTPLTVVLFDVAVPGHSDLTIAGMRLLYTVVGGVLALAACMVLWPTWEPDRLQGEIKNTLLAHARFADAVFGIGLGDTARAEGETARRTAGLANNNLEASLSRSLQEPRRDPALKTGLMVDAALRRIGGTLITLDHETKAASGLDREKLAQWRRWTVAALTTMAAGQPPNEAPPVMESGTLGRLKRGIYLIAASLDRDAHASLDDRTA